MKPEKPGDPDGFALRGFPPDRAAGAALRTVRIIRSRYPDLAVLVCTRDESRRVGLWSAGATVVVPQTLECATMQVNHMLRVMNVPSGDPVLRPGDTVVPQGTREAIRRAESRLLTG